MLARRMFSIRVSTGASGARMALVSVTRFLMSYERSGVFQPEPLPQASNLPPPVWNGKQISGGPASAGVAKQVTTASAMSERVIVVMCDCLLGPETEPTPQ